MTDTELNPHQDAMLKRLARIEGQMRGLQAQLGLAIDVDLGRQRSNMRP